MKKYFFSILFVLIFSVGDCLASGMPDKKDEVSHRRKIHHNIGTISKVEIVPSRIKETISFLIGKQEKHETGILNLEIPYTNNIAQTMYHVPDNLTEFNYDDYLKMLTQIHIKQHEEREKSEWKNPWWTTDEKAETVLTDEAKNFLKTWKSGE